MMVMIVLRKKGNGTDFDIQFKGLLYDFYSKDISQKVKTVADELKKKASFLLGVHLFGYMKASK